MRSESEKIKDNKRVKSFIIIIAILFLIILSRLFYLQIIKGQEYKNLASNNSIKISSIPTLRGNIYTKDDVLLATNVSGYELVLNNVVTISKIEYDFLITNKELDIDAFNNEVDKTNYSKKTKERLKQNFINIKDLQKISNVSYEEIVKILYNKVPYGFNRQLVIDNNISDVVALKNIENIQNENIDILEYDKRYYPHNEIASHIVGNVKEISNEEYEELKDQGYTNRDIIGKKGIERHYDKVLKGSDGRQYSEVSAKGQVLNIISQTDAIKGSDIYLNINYEIQDYMTKEFDNKYGAFIAIEVDTGKIITMVSSPELDLNLLSSKISGSTWNKILNMPEKPLINKAISGLYPPGSTFKVVSGAALLENGVTKNTTVNSTGSFKYSNNIYRDSHRQGHGITNFSKSIEESVNSYYYELINTITIDEFIRISKEFNIGQKTQIDIPYELSGLLPTPDWKKKRFSNYQDQIWLPGDSINMSIGQGYLLVTPIQMLMVYQAIANDGVMLKPQLVDKIVNTNETVNINKEILHEVDISKNTLKLIQEALKKPVKGAHGTAKILNVDFVNVSAKTGTAQNYTGADHSWMAGYFPSEKPKIAFIALVTEGGFGAVEAGSKVRSFLYKYYNKTKEE